MLQSPNSQELSTTIHPNAANYDEASLPQRSHVHGTNSTTSHLKITTSMTNILNVSQVIYIFTNSTMRRRKCHEPRRVVCVTQQRWSHELNDGSCKYHKLVWLPRVLLWMSHVTRMNGSRHKYAGPDMSFFLKQWPYYAYKGSCHTYERVIARTWMSHATHMQAETWVSSSSNGPVTHTYDEWGMSHMWIHLWMSLVTHTSHVTRMNESCHTYAGLDMSFFLKQWPFFMLLVLLFKSHDSFIRVTWDMTRSYVRDVRHDSFICVTRLVYFHAAGTTFRK